MNEATRKMLTRVDNERATSEYLNGESTLKKIWNICNDVYFNNSLPIPRVNICTGRSIHRTQFKNINGYVYKDEKNIGILEVSFPFDIFSYDNRHVMSEVLRAMVQCYCLLNNIKCTSRNGAYFNKRFKEQCELHGLSCKYNKITGWEEVDISDQDETLSYALNLNMISPRLNVSVKHSTPSVAQHHYSRLICPKCGLIFYYTNHKVPTDTTHKPCGCDMIPY